MKNLRHTVPALLSLAIIPAFAQAATIDDCQAIQDRLARYACYDSWDAASGTLRQSAPRTSSAPQPAPELPQAASTDRGESSAADFGRSQSNARVIEGNEGAELIDRIAALEQSGPSMWMITLEGGQQWKQMISKRYNLKVGDEVRIYPTRWGSSYRLSNEQVGSFIQVERVDSLAAAPSEDAPASSAPAPQPAPAPAVVREERSLLGRIFDREDANEGDAPAPVATNASGETTAENFGRNQSDARVIEGTNGQSELIDTIAALEQRGSNMWLVTLSGGQKWQQMITKRYMLRVGDEVRIYPSRWGSSYRLSSPEVGSFIQVQRVD